MDPKHDHGILLAPAGNSCGAAAELRFPGRSAGLPLDEHIVQPEAREEVVRGRRIHAQPAAPPHGDRHCEVDYVVRAHTRRGYISSTDLLTRSSTESDFATDTSVRKEGINRETDERYLEELAIEVVHTQTLRDVTERAEDLTRRGVRRIFAVIVKEGAVKEWSGGAFRALPRDSSIDDRCLSSPIRVEALLNAAEADNAVARALLAKKNPVLTAEAASIRADDILRVLTVRGVPLGESAREKIRRSTDLAELEGWLIRSVTARTADEVVNEEVPDGVR